MSRLQRLACKACLACKASVILEARGAASSLPLATSSCLLSPVLGHPMRLTILRRVRNLMCLPAVMPTEQVCCTSSAHSPPPPPPPPVFVSSWTVQMPCTVILHGHWALTGTSRYHESITSGDDPGAVGTNGSGYACWVAIQGPLINAGVIGCLQSEAAVSKFTESACSR